MRRALQLFLEAARAGDKAAFLNIGYFYDKGVGVKRDRSKALYWYKRAHRQGDSSAANNIGTIWRDQKQMNRALLWFNKAIQMGNDGTNLEVAKHYLRNEDDPTKAIVYLQRVCRSKNVAEVELAQAKRLLKQAERKLPPA